MGFDDDLLKTASAWVENHTLALELIRQGADVLATNWKGETALHLAAEKGHHDICKTLLDHGATVTSTRCGWSALTVAAEYGREKIVRLLLEKGADPNLVTMDHGTALDIALAKNATDSIICLLLEHGADVNRVWQKRTPLHRACEYRRKNVVELLLQKGANMEALDRTGRKPVDISKRRDYEEIVDVFEKRYLLWLRLYHAARLGNYQECVALLELRALVDSSQLGLFCPIAAASNEGHLQIVQLLLQKQTLTNYKGNNERNPLYLAMKKGHKEVVSLLLDKGGNANFKVNGESLLHLATRMARGDLVWLLLQKNVDPNVKDKDGYTPLQLATINGNHDVVACLIKHGANVNSATINMETPLHFACHGGYDQIVQILVEKGAKTDVLNHKDEKPLDVVNGQLKVMENIQKLLMPLKGIAPAPTEESRQHHETMTDHGASGLGYSITMIDPSELDLSSETFKNSDSQELKFKLDRLSTLILELDEKVVDLELAEIDLELETDALKNLNRKIENNRLLMVRNNQDYVIQELSRRMDATKEKQLKLADNVKKVQTEIRLLKIRVQNVCREIARFIK